MDQLTTTLEESFRQASPRSLQYFERACAVMPGGAKGAYFYRPYPLTVASGEGCHLLDVEGRRFVDFANHHSAQILGHCDPTVDEAVRRQMERGIALGSPVGVETLLAEEMCRRVASLERIRFCNSGTEATLHAIRLARGLSGRAKIAKFEGGYHGSHDVVEISVAPPVDQAGSAAEPVSVPTAGGISPHTAREVVVLPYGDERAVGRLIERHRGELACVIFDPKAGILSQRKEFAQFVRRITRDNDVLLILDEIVGFRVAWRGLQHRYGISPDLTTFGKLVGGGFPVGAFGGRADIMDMLDNSRPDSSFFQSGTFSAHPVAMAAGLATLGRLTPEAIDRLNALGDRLRGGLDELFARRRVAARVVVEGSLFSIHFTDQDVADYRALAGADKKMAHRVFLALLEQGYFLSHTLSINALSLPMDASHVDGLVAAMSRAIEQVT